MRPLTAAEKQTLKTACLFCREGDFYLGPQGGLSFNIYCAKCHAGYNVTHDHLPWQLIVLPGEREWRELRPLLRHSPVTLQALFAGLNATIEQALKQGFEKRHGSDD